MSIQLNDPSLLKTASYVNGEWLTTGSQIPVLNPATGETVAEVENLSKDHVTAAIDAADAAMPEWQQKTAKERAAIMRKWYELMLENQDDLGAIMTAEQGKPLAEAKGEVAYGASFIEWFAEEGKRLYGDVIPAHAGDKRIMTIKQGVGVVAAITPWNFPNAMITRKAGPALAAGCSIVIKPATETPLSALALAELADRAGFPKGVLNVVVGNKSREIGGEMTTNPKVRKVSFTGSTPVGKVLMAQCAETVKKTSMELGGNAPFIVFDDADLDAAVQGAILSKYRNAGQTCVCANRILVQDGVYDAFLEKFTAAVSSLKVGDGFEAGVNIGPMINTKAMNDVTAMVADATEKGASVVLGGKPSDLGHSFFEPTILANTTTDMRVFREEIFGPVAPVFRFSTEQEAIAMANDTEFGLASYFYSRDIGRIFRVAEGLDYGIVGINEGIISTEVAPFGGVKESGTGREGSKYGIDDYVEIKYMCLGGIDK